MQKHFLIDNPDEVERCRQSFEGHTPTAINVFDPMTGRINCYSGVVLAVEPVESFGEHWRITIDAGDAAKRRRPEPRATKGYVEINSTLSRRCQRKS